MKNLDRMAEKRIEVAAATGHYGQQVDAPAALRDPSAESGILETVPATFPCRGSSDRAVSGRKSQVQPLNRRSRFCSWLQACQPGSQTTMTASTSSFAAMDVAWGVTINTCDRRHRHYEFLRFLG